jgi:hypothetical protein
MAEPPDQMPAAGRGHLRTSHADREQVIDKLKAAFVQGRLTKDEQDARAGQAFVARTYADLAALTADIPVGLTGARPPEPARESVNKKVAAALACATAAVMGLLRLAWIIPEGAPWVLLPVVMVTLVFGAAVLGGWLGLFAAWLHDRSGGCSTRGLPVSGRGGASQRPRSADPGRQLPPTDLGHRHTAEAAQRRLPRSSLPGPRALRRWRTRGLLAGQRPAVTGAP